MGSFVFTQYQGEDAGQVLALLLSGGEPDIVDADSETEIADKKHPVGFTPNDEEEKTADDEETE